MNQDELKVLLKKIRDGDQPVLVCTHVHPGKTPWPHAEGSCGLCGSKVWRDGRNTQAIAEAGLMLICIPCLVKYGFLDEALDNLRSSDKGSLVDGQFMTVKQGVETALEELNPTPKDDTN